MATAAQVRAAFDLVIAVSEAIRELGEVPNGELYARVMGTLDYQSYTHIIAQLKRAGLVRETSNLLVWIGPLKGVRR